ncbi:MAG: hypothetical protein WBW94_07740 [Anaerolineales bacterium]
MRYETLNPGKLYFTGANAIDVVDIYWMIIYGDPEQKNWKANVSFTSGWSIPQRALELLFQALEENSSTRVEFEPKNGIKVKCAITDISDLSDGAIEIGNPELGQVIGKTSHAKS